MDIQKDYLCIEENSRVICKNIDLDFDFQESLPAYVDDVYRVVKCTARSYITSADITFNEIKVYGKVNICVTYFNENAGLCFADFEEDFTKSLTVDNLSDNAFVNACISDKYTSFRVINQRRIDIHLSSLLHIDVYDKISCPCLKDCENSKLKTESVKAANILTDNISRIEFDEEFGISADSSGIKRIISFNANAYTSDLKVIKDKALIKANVDISVLYTTDESEEQIFKSEYSFTTSKIIEISGVKDTDILITDISVGNVFIKAKNKTGDKLDTINVYGELSANTLVFREEEQDIVTDAYVLNRNSSNTYSDYTMLTNGRVINEVRQVNISFSLPQETSEIKEISLEITSFILKNSKINADVRYNAVTQNGESGLTSIFGDGEFEIPVENYDGMLASLSVQSFDFNLQNNSLEVRAAIAINAYVYNEVSYKLISDIEAEDDVINYPTITVYFGKENEEVWDIAKAFSSDIEQIMRENSLSGDKLDSNRVLIIPKA